MSRQYGKGYHAGKASARRQDAIVGGIAVGVAALALAAGLLVSKGKKKKKS